MGRKCGLQTSCLASTHELTYIGNQCTERFSRYCLCRLEPEYGIHTHCGAVVMCCTSMVFELLFYIMMWGCPIASQEPTIEQSVEEKCKIMVQGGSYSQYIIHLPKTIEGRVM